MEDKEMNQDFANKPILVATREQIKELQKAEAAQLKAYEAERAAKYHARKATIRVVNARRAIEGRAPLKELP